MKKEAVYIQYVLVKPEKNTIRVSSFKVYLILGEKQKFVAYNFMI